MILITEGQNIRFTEFFSPKKRNTFMFLDKFTQLVDCTEVKL